MSEMSHEDALSILKSIGEIKEDIAEIRLTQQETSGQMKGNSEITELKLRHLEETNQLRSEKYQAQIDLVNEQVQLNKSSIASLFTANTDNQAMKAQLKGLFAALVVMAPMIVVAFVYGILIYGKVKGF